MGVAVEVAAPARAQLGEGPGWDGGRECLHWVDITKGEVHRFRPGGGDALVAALGTTVAAAVPRAQGGLVVAAAMGVALLDDAGRVEWKATTTIGDRMNEAKCDPAGRLFVGSMTFDRRPEAALFRLEADMTLTPVLAGVRLSNGMGWSPAGDRFYYIDTPTRRIDVCDYDLAGGQLSERRPFAEIGEMPGNPDGLTVDAEGGVWVVLCRGSSLRRFGPDGGLDAVVDLPVSRATSCAFGGPDGGDLYVTTGRFDLSEAELEGQPLAGSLLVCRPGVAGPPMVAYAG